MKTTTPKMWLMAAICSLIACLLQIIGLVRYLNRLPEDRVGIGLYIVTIVAFAIGAVGFYIRWQGEKK